jgi:sialic acid synthase SpsE
MTQAFRLGNKWIGGGAPCFVIAEAGSNHDGSYARAIELIDVAADAGVDAVKFQLFSADRIAADTRHPLAAIEFAGARSLYELYGMHETPAVWLPGLFEHARARGIVFLCTPFDEDSADLLESAGIEAYKIASFEIVHLPLLRHVAARGRPILLSTGMSTLGEIEEALAGIRCMGEAPVALLHCGIGYPLPFDAVNLRAMRTMDTAFGLPTGYSDHTPGIEVALAVAALGGAVVEKHFTLNRNLPGPDHSFALEPDELAAMVVGIRRVEAALGVSRKAAAPVESEHLVRGRRSIFAAEDIPAGGVIEHRMISVLRPGAGLAPREIPNVIGRIARRDIRRHEPLTWDDV